MKRRMTCTQIHLKFIDLIVTFISGFSLVKRCKKGVAAGESQSAGDVRTFEITRIHNLLSWYQDMCLWLLIQLRQQMQLVIFLKWTPTHITQVGDMVLHTRSCNCRLVPHCFKLDQEVGRRSVHFEIAYVIICSSGGYSCGNLQSHYCVLKLIFLWNESWKSSCHLEWMKFCSNLALRTWHSTWLITGRKCRSL